MVIANVSRSVTRSASPKIFQKQDFRTIRLPAEATTLFVEPGPNMIDENSAVLVAYQVG
jgi:hypothetical protein